MIDECWLSRRGFSLVLQNGRKKDPSPRVPDLGHLEFSDLGLYYITQTQTIDQSVGPPRTVAELSLTERNITLRLRNSPTEQATGKPED